MSEITFPRSGAVRDTVLSYLRKNPGNTAEWIAHINGLNLTSVRSILSKLAQHGGVVARYRKGREFVYALADQVSAPVKEPEAADADTAALQAKLAELEAKVAELADFKAEAIERYPDLEDEEYEAYRDILSQFYRDQDDLLEAALLQDQGYGLDDDHIGTIKALINAAKAIVQIEGWADADPA